MSDFDDGTYYANRPTESVNDMGKRQSIVFSAAFGLTVLAGCYEIAACMESCVAMGDCVENCCEAAEAEVASAAIDLHACRIEVCGMQCRTIDVACM